MLRLFRHLAYEGPRHRGDHVRARRLPHHYELHTPMALGWDGRQHLLTTRAGLAALAAMTPGAAGHARLLDIGTPELIGIPIYVDTCPCADRPPAQWAGPGTVDVGDLAAVADMRAMLRAVATLRRPQYPGDLITGSQT